MEGRPHGLRPAATILDLGIELARRIPEQAERALTASVIPHARRHDSAWANDAHHFAQPLSGICHEVNDELRENSVECLVREGSCSADPSRTSTPG